MTQKKILFIGLSGAGDVLMSTALTREIRKNYPKARIDYLVMQGKITRELLKNNKDIDNIIYFNFIKEGFFKSLVFCSKLETEKYDLSITVYPQARIHYSVVSWLIHAKKRIGFNYESQKIKLNRLFFTDTINENYEEHVVYNNMKVLDVLELKRTKKPRLILNLSKEDIEFANEYFRKNKIGKAVVIHAGSGTTKSFIRKRWPKERFAELCRKISYKAKIILAGGPDELELKKYIIENSKLNEGRDIFNFDGDIGKTAAIILKSNLVVSNDSVFAHIAGALNKEVVVLFGPTYWKNISPFTEKKHIICKEDKPSWRHGQEITEEQGKSIKKIKLEDVYYIVNKLLK